MRRTPKENINQSFINLIRKAHGLIENSDIEKHRHSQDQMGALFGNSREVAVTETTVGSMYAEWIRVDRPHSGKKIILYCHGGGYSTGSPLYARTLTTKLASQLSMDVFCFDYRLAPEHPYPAAVDDAQTAWDYLMLQGYGAKDIFVAGDSRSCPAEALGKFLKIIYISGGANERSRDEIKAHFCTEFQVVHITLGKIRHGKLNAGNVDSLIVGKRAAVNYRADNIGVGYLFCSEFNCAVIYKDSCTNAYVLWKVFEVDVSLFCGTFALDSCECDSVTVGNIDRLVVNKLSKSYFRAFCIEHCGNGQTEFVSQTCYLFKAALVYLIIAV